MHASTFRLMQEFAEKVPASHKTVLDVGSRNVNGTYRDIFPEEAGWSYTGLDIVQGKNVDIIVPAYDWSSEVKEGSFDVVISGQCAEHVPDIYAWIRQISRAVRSGGLVCIIAPWKWHHHRYPVDCWRILPDGMKFLMGEIGGLNVTETMLNKEGDCRGIASRP